MWPTGGRRGEAVAQMAAPVVHIPDQSERIHSGWCVALEEEPGQDVRGQRGMHDLLLHSSRVNPRVAGEAVQELSQEVPLPVSGMPSNRWLYCRL